MFHKKRGWKPSKNKNTVPAQNFTGSYEKVCLKKMQSEKLLWFCFFAQEHGCL